MGMWSSWRLKTCVYKKSHSLKGHSSRNSQGESRSRGEETEWGRLREKQPLPAGSLMQDSVPKPWDQDWSRRQPLNRLSHAGAQAFMVWRILERHVEPEVVVHWVRIARNHPRYKIPRDVCPGDVCWLDQRCKGKNLKMKELLGCLPRLGITEKTCGEGPKIWQHFQMKIFDLYSPSETVKCITSACIEPGVEMEVTNADALINYFHKLIIHC